MLLVFFLFLLLSVCFGNLSIRLHSTPLSSGERHIYHLPSYPLQRSVMNTPVGKGGGLNVTVDIEVNLTNAFWHI